jgi:hypothetical protein
MSPWKNRVRSRETHWGSPPARPMLLVLALIMQPAGSNDPPLKHPVGPTLDRTAGSRLRRPRAVGDPQLGVRREAARIGPKGSGPYPVVPDGPRPLRSPVAWLGRADSIGRPPTVKCLRGVHDRCVALAVVRGVRVCRDDIVRTGGFGARVGGGMRRVDGCGRRGTCLPPQAGSITKGMAVAMTARLCQSRDEMCARARMEGSNSKVRARPCAVQER